MNNIQLAFSVFVGLVVSMVGVVLLPYEHVSWGLMGLGAVVIGVSIMNWQSTRRELAYIPVSGVSHSRAHAIAGQEG